MHFFKPQNWSMLSQILALFVLAGLLIGVLSGRQIKTQETEYLRSQQELQYQQLLKVLSQSTKDAIIAEDVSLLKTLIEDVGQNDSNISGIQIYNDERRVIVEWVTNRPSNTIYELPQEEILIDGRYQGGILLQVDLSIAMANIQQHVEQIQLMIGGLLALLLTLIALLVYRVSIQPIQAIEQRLIEIGQGDFQNDFFVPAASEIQQLTKSLNQVSVELESQRDTELRHRDELKSMNQALVRFVPQNFLSYLQRDSIVDVALGDQVETDMAVLFTDIRSFTPLSESLTAAETFEFINSYLHEMGPLIRQHNGFIDKYIGDAIMALFPKSEDAVMAGLSLLQKLKVFNAHRIIQGKKAISIGVGIHTGRVMLGTIGEADRMEGTVIGDTVNLAARLENLTKKYKLSFLISEACKDQLSNQSLWSVRFVDSVIAKGKSVPTNIYEVFCDKTCLEADVKSHNAALFEQHIPKVTADPEALDWKHPDPMVELYIQHLKSRPDQEEF